MQAMPIDEQMTQKGKKTFEIWWRQLEGIQETLEIEIDTYIVVA